MNYHCVSDVLFFTEDVKVVVRAVVMYVWHHEAWPAQNSGVLLVLLVSEVGDEG